MNISVATSNQLSVVKDLAYKIWPDAYKTILSNDQLDYMLDMFYNVNALQNQIQNGHVFLLLEFNDNYIGFASYELNCNATTKTKIQKLYVLPEIQGKGFGKSLVNFIKHKAILAKNTALFLNVNKYNVAKDFYLKHGFKIVKEEVIAIGNDYVMDDYVMEINL